MLVVKSFLRSRNGLVVIGAVLVLGIVEILVRTDVMWELIPTSESNEHIAVSEVALKGANPRVVVFGNSIMRNAFAPRVLADSLGVGQNEVVSLAASNATALDFELIYRRNRAQLAQADIAVFAIEPREFIADPNSTRFRRFATFEDRLSVHGWQNRLSLVAGMVWRTWDARSQMSGYLREFFIEHRFDRDEPSMDPLGRISLHGPTSGTSLAEIRAKGRDDAEEFQFEEGANTRAFLSLVAMLRQDGTRLILVDSPSTSTYLAVYDEIAGGERARLKEWLVSLGSSEVRTVDWSPDQHCPEITYCYIDYAHLNANGAVLYTMALATLLSGL